MKSKYLVFRLHRNDDLYDSIIKKCVENHLIAAAVVAAVGCIKELRIRLADGMTVYQQSCDFEVTALSGTISEDGLHLHIQVCDKELRSLGGHLLSGTKVNTTMEIVIVNLEGEYQLSRVEDATTGYDELVVTTK